MEFTVQSKNLANGQLITEQAIRETDFSDREGYSAEFLNRNIKLPKIKDELRKHLAKNQSPGRNGEDYLDYTHFSVMFNKDKKLPFYTAVNIEGASNEIARVHDARSGDSWFADTRLQIDGENFQYSNSEYTNSGFQRGHMVRFYDPAWGRLQKQRKVAMGDTFHFTNCCPQVGKFNAGVWNDLEDYCLARSIFQDGKISVFTGPIFNKAKEINGLLVPLNFWKVIIYNKGKAVEAMGFLISHELAMHKLLSEVAVMEAKQVKPTLKQEDIERLFEKKDLKRWTVKIQLIEEKTGITFGLSDFDINRNESRLFYANAEYINTKNLINEFEQFIIKNDNSALSQEINRMKYLMTYNEHVSQQRKQEVDYTAFIDNI